MLYLEEEFPVYEEVDDIMKWIVGDFETSNSDINIANSYTRVWLWDIYDHEEKHHYNGTAPEFNSSSVWGPLMGRKFYVGLRFNIY